MTAYNLAEFGRDAPVTVTTTTGGNYMALVLAFLPGGVLLQCIDPDTDTIRFVPYDSIAQIDQAPS